MNNKKRFLTLLIGGLLSFALLVGCTTTAPVEDSPEPEAETETPSEEVVGDGDFKIGITHYGLQSEFTTLIARAQQEIADELGVEIEIFDGNYDVNTQIGQFENMIAQGFDAIIFSPVDAEAMSIAVDKAHDAGVPVIGVNTRVESDKLTAYVGSDDVTAGEIEMEYIAEKMGGKGNIVVMEGPIGQSAQIQRREGIHNVLEQYPDIEILSEKTANWSRSEGLSLMENWLQAFAGQIDAVVSQNDEMALGAINALEEKGLKNEIPVIGVDAISDALESVKQGIMDATVFQDAQGQGTKSVEVALSYLKGEPIEEEYWIPFELVTQDTAQDFLDKIK